MPDEQVRRVVAADGLLVEAGRWVEDFWAQKRSFLDPRRRGARTGRWFASRSGSGVRCAVDMLRSLLAILVAVLATVCLSDFARAAMPADDMADCPARLCDGDLGCGTPVKPQALRPPPTSPAIVVVPSGTLGAPPPAADTIVRPTPDASSSRPLARLAPRAPPGAA